VHELGLDDEGRLYFTMRLVRGRDLSEVFEELQRGSDGWTVTRAVGALLKACEAMAYAHSKRVIHRDLKPANIMVGRFGEVYVMDWGLARVLGREDPRDLRLVHQPAAPSMVLTDRRDARDSDAVAASSDSPLLTRDGDIVGTPSYMSPEQARGDLAVVGPASDVYSLGAILYHLLAGRMPFVPQGEKTSAHVVWTRLREGPPEPLRELAPSTPEELVAICEKAMAREPDARYVDTLDMAEDLRAYLEGRVVRAHATGALVEFKKWVARNKALAGTAAAALLLTIGSLSWAAWTTRATNLELAGTNTSLNAANKGLNDANEELREKGGELLAKQFEIDILLHEAQTAQLEAQRQAYAANIAAAAIHLVENNGEEMQRRLEACPPELRWWEWKHLSLNQSPSLLAFDVAGGGAWQAAWMPGAQAVVAAGPLGTFSAHDAASGGLVGLQKAHATDAVSLAVSEDGARMASGARDGSLLVWNTTGGGAPRTLVGHRYEVGALAFAPDGRLISGEGYSVPTALASVATSTSAPKDCRLYVWDPATGERLMTLEGHEGPVLDLAVSPDGTQVCSVSRDRTARMWSLDTGELLGTEESGLSANAVAYRQDGKQIAWGGTMSTISLKDLGSGKTLDLRGHGDTSSGFGTGGMIHDLAYSPDGQRLASASADGTVRIWDTTTGASISVLQGHRGEVDSVAFSPGGERLVSAGRSDGVRIWDSRTAPPVTELSDADRRVRAQELTYPDSRGGRAERLWWYDDVPEREGGSVLLDQVAAYCPATGLLAHRGRARRLKKEFTVDLWDAVSGAHVATLAGHRDEVTGLAATSDGALVASASKDRTVRVWSTASSELERTLAGFKAGVEAVAFDSLGTQLAIGTSDGRVFVYDFARTQMREAQGRHEGAVTRLAWDGDGELIASGGIDDTVLLWRARDCALVRTLHGHQGDINDLLFHPQGRRLFSAARDRSVRVWSTETGEALLSFPDFRASVVRLALARDGRRLIAVEALGLRARVRVLDSNFADLQGMWRSRETARVAQVLVDRLAAEHESVDSLVAAILAEGELDSEVRAAAAALARAMSE
jgi:WD40 repeat protein